MKKKLEVLESLLGALNISLGTQYGLPVIAE